MLVVVPGMWSEPQALVGADAVLLTHDHPDHADLLRLAGLAVPVFAPVEADLGGLDAHRLGAGSEFVAAGFAVRAVGGEHARVLPDQLLGANLGYLVEDTLYHPGDALHVPQQRVEVVMVPMQASWLKTSESVAFLRAVAPRLALGMHDAQVNERADEPQRLAPRCRQHRLPLAATRDRPAGPGVAGRSVPVLRFRRTLARCALTRSES